MYESYFGLKEKPFSIAPDPRYIYLSDAHEDALAHLLFGVQEGGGFALLTGEVGTGKTTLLRTMVQQLPGHIDLALVFNPMLSPLQFVATVCDELKIAYDAENVTLKTLVDALNKHLLDSSLEGRRTILVIDEAQALSVEVLEQIRLLTNLETTREKLLQIFLIGQPELRETLARTDMRQLAQRITDVFHLETLGQQEVHNYLRHRLTIAGAQKPIFSDSAVRAIYRASAGVPRLVNELADKALLAAYAGEKRQVNRKMVRQAASQVLASHHERSFGWMWGVTAGVVIMTAAGILYLRGQSAQIPIDPLLQQPITSSPQTGGQAPVDAPAAGGMGKPVDAPALISNGVSTPSYPSVESENPATAHSTEPQVQQADEPMSAEMDSVIQPLQEAAEESSTQLPLASGSGQETPQRENNQLQPPDSQPASEQQAGHATAGSQTIGLDAWIYDHGEETSREQALKELVSVWDVDPGPGAEPCDEIAGYGLRCLKMHGSWAMINEINRPVIIKLHMGDQRSHYVTLLGSSDDAVVIRFNTEIFHFPLKELSARWFGEFELIWQAPPMGFRSTIRPGDRGDQIGWLRDRLREINGEETPPENGEDHFDESLAEAVRLFQISNHLIPDAMVGEQTIIRLNSASPSDSGPRLKVSG